MEKLKLYSFNELSEEAQNVAIKSNAQADADQQFVPEALKFLEEKIQKCGIKSEWNLEERPPEYEVSFNTSYEQCEPRVILTQDGTLTKRQWINEVEYIYEAGFDITSDPEWWISDTYLLDEVSGMLEKVIEETTPLFQEAEKRADDYRKFLSSNQETDKRQESYRKAEEAIKEINSQIEETAKKNFNKQIRDTLDYTYLYCRELENEGYYTAEGIYYDTDY